MLGTTHAHGNFGACLEMIRRGLFQNPPTDIIQNIYRRSETDDDSDTDSAAGLEYDTWNDPCAREFRSASGNDSPGLIQNPPTDIIQNTRYCTDDDEYPEKLGDGGYVDGGIQYPRFCLRNNDNGLYPKLTSCCHTDDMDFLSLAACYDCTCLMSLIWITTSLSSDREGRSIELDMIGVMTVPQLGN